MTTRSSGGERGSRPVSTAAVRHEVALAAAEVAVDGTASPVRPSRRAAFAPMEPAEPPRPDRSDDPEPRRHPPPILSQTPSSPRCSSTRPAPAGHGAAPARSRCFLAFAYSRGLSLAGLEPRVDRVVKGLGGRRSDPTSRGERDLDSSCETAADLPPTAGRPRTGDPADGATFRPAPSPRSDRRR
jgi:hypothetical protein